MSLALDLTPPLPANNAGVLNRWVAEPVHHIFLPASAFIANVKGYPVLPKGTQAFLRQSMIVSRCIVYHYIHTSDSGMDISTGLPLSFPGSGPAFMPAAVNLPMCNT